MTRAGRLPSAPIWLQILTLLIGGLIAAQIVTLALTVLLPPAPPQQHSLGEIAQALRGGALRTDNRTPLIRSLETAPPSLQSPGWVVSEGSTAELVKLLAVAPSEVRLLFYAPPPLAGAGPPAPRGLAPAARLDAPRQVRFASFVLVEQTLAGPTPGTQGAVAIAPASVAGPVVARPDGFVRAPGARGAIPGGAIRSVTGAGLPSPPFGGFRQGPPTGRRGGAGAATPGFQRDPGVRSPAGMGMAPSGPIGIQPAAPGARPGGGAFVTGPRFGPTRLLPPRVAPRDDLEAAAFDGVRAPSPPAGPRPVPAPAPSLPTRINMPESLVAIPTPAVPLVIPAAPPPAPALTRPVAAPVLAAPAAVVAAVAPQPDRALPAPQRPTVFGLVRTPYVEGEFVAALRGGDGRWITVRPEPEGFPNSWQRRVLLWFGLALMIVAPLGYLFARRLAAPLHAFAAAAERLGRDPSADLAPLAGPAEVGQAARAFNLMQRRLKRYVEDRTGMIGAISHDLRTPLARMRFKLERLPPAARASLDRDIRQMEEMIDSVLSFMRDEAAGAARQRVDLRSLLECVVDEADGAAELDPGASVEVEVDLLGFQRVFENLVGNAVKYGGHAQVRLLVRGGEAVVEVADQGRGLADEELERVFQPFYRGVEAKASGKAGMGLGLAVSRSTVRAHGGDLTLRRGEPGLVAEVRLPLPQPLTRLVSVAA